jgi:hypothetical protein
MTADYTSRPDKVLFFADPHFLFFRKPTHSNHILFCPHAIAKEQSKQKEVALSIPLRIITSMIILLFLFNSCSVTKNVYSIEKISFGNGGGFTGNIIEYSIDTNGTITKFEIITKKTITIKTIEKKDIRNIYRKAEELPLETYEFNYPGNTYNFIKVLKNGKEYYISWGDGKHSVKSEFEEFYNNLLTLLNH